MAKLITSFTQLENEKTNSKYTIGTRFSLFENTLRYCLVEKSTFKTYQVVYDKVLFFKIKKTSTLIGKNTTETVVDFGDMKWAEKMSKKYKIPLEIS